MFDKLQSVVSLAIQEPRQTEVCRTWFNLISYLGVDMRAYTPGFMLCLHYRLAAPCLCYRAP
jgi:hypothetical protein